MKTVFKEVPITKIYTANSNVNLAKAASVIFDSLNKAEAEIYWKAMVKIRNKQNLNRRDLLTFDKIDAITFRDFGICLKDSVVTKARIKASKKYSIEFIDRDGLVEHMNRALGMVH